MDKCESCKRLHTGTSETQNAAVDDWMLFSRSSEDHPLAEREAAQPNERSLSRADVNNPRIKLRKNFGKKRSEWWVA